MGEINQEIMNSLFREGITVQDYLSFFLQFMSSDLKVEKDLGTCENTQENGTKSISCSCRAPKDK